MHFRVCTSATLATVFQTMLESQQLDSESTSSKVQRSHKKEESKPLIVAVQKNANIF